MIGKEKKVKQWLSRMKLAHKMVLGFLGLIGSTVYLAVGVQFCLGCVAL